MVIAVKVSRDSAWFYTFLLNLMVIAVKVSRDSAWFYTFQLNYWWLPVSRDSAWFYTFLLNLLVIAGQSWQRVILYVPVELNGDCRKGQSWQRVILYVPVELIGDCRSVVTARDSIRSCWTYWWLPVSRDSAWFYTFLLNLMVIASQSWQRVILYVPVELNGDCQSVVTARDSIRSCWT